jgi:voltage-gated potassium channel
VASLLLGLARFWSAIRKAWSDPTFRTLAALTASLLLVGTFVFNRIEGWSFLDSFYYSAVTAATVGFGDFVPKTPAGKLLTVLYMFCGIGLLVALLTRFADALIQSERENQERLHQHLSHVRESFGHGSGDAAQPGSADAPAVDKDDLA